MNQVDAIKTGLCNVVDDHKLEGYTAIHCKCGLYINETTRKNDHVKASAHLVDVLCQYTETLHYVVMTIEVIELIKQVADRAVFVQVEKAYV